MKIKKLKKFIKKASSFLDSDKRSRNEKKKYLRQVLRELRCYEIKLRAQLEEETDRESRARLEKRLALTHEQRKKGLRLLKEWQAE